MTEAEEIRIDTLERQVRELKAHIRYIGKEWAREVHRAESALAALKALRTWRDDH